MRAFFLALFLLWPATQARALDASPWDRVLAAHAKRGGVAYAALRADATAMADLTAFLRAAETMPETEPLSTWLNVYNALVVKSLVDRYPTPGPMATRGFFDAITHRVAGRARTLNGIENDVIRARFRDARIHVALNCGAASCPPLHGRAFVERTLGATLDRLCRAAMARDDFVRVTGTSVALSEIFFWYEADFVRDGGSMLAWARRYDATGRLAAVPTNAVPTRIPYRWALNDRP